jgi:hypothetical protein
MAGPAFTVHSLEHLHAVLRVAADTGLHVVTLSGPGASAYAGPSWFAGLIAAAAAEFPNVALTAVLDCGDRAGDALVALGLGLTHLIFTGNPEAAARLSRIAAAQGAEILDRRPEALDLLDIKDLDRAVRKYCGNLPALERSSMQSPIKQSPESAP